MYTMTEVESLTGVSRRQIRRWRELGLLDPPVGASRGVAARWTDSHVRAIQRIKDEYLDSPARSLKGYAEYVSYRRGNADEPLGHSEP